MRPAALALLSLAMVVTVPGCAPSYKRGLHDVVFQRAPEPVLHQSPRSSIGSTNWWDEVLHSVVLPLGKMGSPAYLVSKTIGGPRALDVNAFEQVPDSTWFENRINRGMLTTTDLERGPDPARAPAPGRLTIISGKLEGIAPGFVARDQRGVVWFVKFDTPTYPELATGAEMVGSRILWAAGYHVPENYLVDLELSRLRLDPSARTRNDYNQDVPMSQAALDVLLLQLNPGEDGRLRALFSRTVPGRPIGSFHFRGVRRGDPNDTIAHERRRSLRGLWVFFAWINNTDARHQNTIDTFITVGKEQLGYLKHYLIDFGDSLGSAGDGEKHTAEGYERRIEWHEIGLRYLTLGFRDPTWFRVKRSSHREVGVFESKIFEPSSWVPVYTNPAFLAADADDTFWAASILAHFTRADIEAAVAAGEYRDDAVYESLVRTLIERRAKLLRHAFARRGPLDTPRVLDGVLRLTDLVVLAELAEPAARYHWTVRWNRTGAGDPLLPPTTTDRPELPIEGLIAQARQRWGADFDRDPYLAVTAQRALSGSRGPAVTVQLRVTATEAFAVGISR